MDLRKRAMTLLPSTAPTARNCWRSLRQGRPLARRQQKGAAKFIVRLSEVSRWTAQAGSTYLMQLTGPGETRGRCTAKAPLRAPPQRHDISSMVFHLDRQYEPSGHAGVLYGGAPSGEAAPPGVPQSSLGYILAPPVENPPAVESESVSQVGNPT